MSLSTLAFLTDVYPVASLFLPQPQFPIISSHSSLSIFFSTLMSHLSSISTCLVLSTFRVLNLTCNLSSFPRSTTFYINFLSSCLCHIPPFRFSFGHQESYLPLSSSTLAFLPDVNTFLVHCHPFFSPHLRITCRILPIHFFRAGRKPSFPLGYSTTSPFCYQMSTPLALPSSPRLIFPISPY